MAQLLPRLTPYWFTPESEKGSDSPPRFRLRPLSQAQLVELYDSYQDGKPTNATWYRAGELVILEVGDIQDENGNPAKWPQCKPRVPAEWVAECGAKAWLVANGIDGDDGEELEKNS